MKKLANIFLVFIAILSLSSCVAPPDDTCTPLDSLFDVSGLNSNVKMIGIPTGLNDADGNPIKRGIVTWVSDKITEVMTNSSEEIYKVIGENDRYKRLIGLAITLTIMFYALSVMLGLTQANGYYALTFAIKIAVVYALATNWGTFYFYVGETFEALVNSMTEYAGETFSDYSAINSTVNSVPLTGGATGDGTLFGDIDIMLSILWNFDLIKAILALMFTGFTGFFWGIMLLALIVLYLFAIIVAVKTFLLALVGRYVLYALAPLFLVFALFNQTKSLFDNWLRQLISFTLQPIFLFIFLSMFQMILGGMMFQIYQQGLDGALANSSGTGGGFDQSCVAMVAPDNAGDAKMKFFKLCRMDENSENGFVCEENSVKPDIPLDIWIIISCLIICYLMFSMVHWVVNVANSLAGGVITVSDTQVPGFDRVQNSAKGGLRQLGQGIMKGGGTTKRSN